MVDHPFQRKSIRIPEFDYGSPGWYFITLITLNRVPILGEIRDRKILLTFAGNTSEKELLRLPSRFPHVLVNEYIIMPDHIHMILQLDYTNDGSGLRGFSQTLEPRDHRHVPPAKSIYTNTTILSSSGKGTAGTTPTYESPLFRRAPTESSEEKFGKPAKGTIPTIIRSYKSSVAFRLHLTRDYRNTGIWQRNYYEHVIRSDADYEQIAWYIKTNPGQVDEKLNSVLDQ
jgi:putative transposase